MEHYEHHEVPHTQTCIIHVNPFLTTERIEKAAMGAEAIILITYASGTVPEKLIPIIKFKVEMGVPVLLVSNNPGDTHGILNEKKYDPQANVASTGAIALKSVNVNNIDNILAAIDEESLLGKTGKDLGEAIHKRFN